MGKMGDVAANVEYERLSIGGVYDVDHHVGVPGLDPVMMEEKVKRLKVSLRLVHPR